MAHLIDGSGHYLGIQPKHKSSKPTLNWQTLLLVFYSQLHADDPSCPYLFWSSLSPSVDICSRNSKKFHSQGKEKAHYIVHCKVRIYTIFWTIHCLIFPMLQSYSIIVCSWEFLIIAVKWDNSLSDIIPSYNYHEIKEIRKSCGRIS